MKRSLGWRIVAAAFLATTVFYAPCALAHKTSYGHLKADISGRAIKGEVELAVRDFDFAFFDFAFGPVANGDGQPDWRQLRRHEPEIDAILLNKLSFGAPGAPCSLSPGPISVDLRGGEYFLSLPFSGACDAPGEPAQVGYDLMFDVDPQHRAIIEVTRNGEAFSGLISPEAKVLQLSAGATALSATVLAYVLQGAHHIWIGYDHILFLFSLLLPAVLMRMKDQWLPVKDLADAFWSIARIVTAFTLAHSITLSVAAFGILELPSRFVESAIAASVVVAAVNNIYPVMTDKLWAVAFGFGLIHGFGFASVLNEFGLPPERKFVSLISFNVGVELGQLAIVAAILPVLFLARRSIAYTRLVMPLGSLAISMIALIWLIERMTGVGDFLGG
ncbi:HupE/UreJ family protein [Methylocapsa palsarum]|uniref:HupE / UreJ protein n=1 Tax=Methylocapsa palsarum TaxID=1612308 RepID=A0A1I4BK71_9HYPH|nr:HupE/UreJ family protein [Methylocapsa palsarum]SFK69224.1 HupE / UreJ protein [Methylocapsa palsarum]